jgi:hypothetical protein
VCMSSRSIRDRSIAVVAALSRRGGRTCVMHHADVQCTCATPTYRTGSRTPHAAKRGNPMPLLRRVDRGGHRRLRRRPALHRGLPSMLPADFHCGHPRCRWPIGDQRQSRERRLSERMARAHASTLRKHCDVSTACAVGALVPLRVHASTWPSLGRVTCGCRVACAVLAIAAMNGGFTALGTTGEMLRD